MDLVNLVYKYVNRFINSETLIEELKSFDKSKYLQEEVESIKELIRKIEKIRESTPNEMDKIEKNRLSNLNHMIELMEKNFDNEKMDEKSKKFLKERYDSLLKEKKIIKDGGKLYQSIFELITNHELINKYASSMNDLELLEFITQYISVPLPPLLNQGGFDNLVFVGIKEDKREALWRLAFTYENKNINFSKIEDYFILKRDEYYLTELISAVRESLNMTKLIDKIIDTKDKEFINKIIETANKMYLFEDNELEKIKEGRK